MDPTHTNATELGRGQSIRSGSRRAIDLEHQVVVIDEEIVVLRRNQQIRSEAARWLSEIAR